LAAIDHPNIVKVYDAGQVDGIYYMAMEFVQGRDLGDVLKENGTLPLAEIQPFLRDFAGALDYAHERGLVHRDIKPSNIMVRLKPDRSSYEVVLMDFGVAKLQDAQTELTGTGAIGTIDYMAPEQIMAAKAVDHRADIYALGIVLYEMLTGECPFKGTPGQVLFAHLQQPAPDPRTVKPDIPVSIAEAVLRALDKNPDARFQTASAMAAALVDPW
jgi:eukaryotic-like serine/threonine-protein kinase